MNAFKNACMFAAKHKLLSYSLIVGVIYVATTPMSTPYVPPPYRVSEKANELEKEKSS